MEKIFIKSPVIIRPESDFNNKVADVLVTNGQIVQIGIGLSAGDDTQVFEAEGLYLCPGFFDLNANFGEPGFENREDLITGSFAAAAGGFTGVLVHPNTEPVIDSKSEVAYIVNKTRGGIVDVFPAGSISAKRKGQDLAELYDMKLAGAVAFTNGDSPVVDSGLMSRALMYAKGINALILSYPEDASIAGKGKMNEGTVSTLLGMKGIPALAEEVMISRDLYLAEYNESPIHFSTISTAGSVDLVRAAKKKGLKVTCDVAAHHLVLTEEELHGFDSNYKVKPPLRTRRDVDALIEGVKDGTIDAIVSQHTPYEIEHKEVEFEIASFGIIGLQTVLPLLLKAGLDIQLIVQKLAINPRKVLSLPVPRLAENAEANLVLLDPNKEWILNENTNKSKSINSPFWQKPLTGKPVLVINHHQVLHLN